nr:hypothetical protein [Tanacetum cinerariifolium]
MLARSMAVKLIVASASECLFAEFLSEMEPKKFEKLMTKKLEMSMMGELTYFIGLQIKQDDKGISICQEKYKRDLLKKYEIFDNSLVKTLIVPPNNLGPELASKPVNETINRGKIRITSHYCKKFLIPESNPSIGLWYPKCSEFDLKGYLDSDYVGCNMDKKAPQVLGENYSSIKQLNSIQQLLAFSLLTGTKIDMGEIIFSDLVTRLMAKSRQIYVSYPRFVSCARERLSGFDYSQDKKFRNLPNALKGNTQPAIKGSYSPLDEGIHKSKPLHEDKMTNPQDSKGNKQTADIGLLATTPNEEVEPDIETLLLTTVADIQALLVYSKDELKDENAREVMDEDIQEPCNEETHESPSPTKYDPESSKSKQPAGALDSTSSSWLNRILTNLKEVQDAIKEDPALNKKVLEATKAYTKNLTNLIELLTMGESLAHTDTIRPIKETPSQTEGEKAKMETEEKETADTNVEKELETKTILITFPNRGKGITKNTNEPPRKIVPASIKALEDPDPQCLYRMKFMENCIISLKSKFKLTWTKKKRCSKLPAKQVIEHPENGIFFIDVFGDEAFQRMSDIHTVDVHTLLSYMVMALNINTPTNQRLCAVMRSLSESHLDKEKLKSKKVKLVDTYKIKYLCIFVSSFVIDY